MKSLNQWNKWKFWIKIYITNLPILLILSKIKFKSNFSYVYYWEIILIYLGYLYRLSNEP